MNHGSSPLKGVYIVRKQHFPNENGEITINGHIMSWQMKRCRTPSAFGVRGSRIFYLELKKDGKTVCKFDHGWDISKRLNNEDEEAVLCVSYLVDKFGKDTPKKVKERGFQE